MQVVERRIRIRRGRRLIAARKVKSEIEARVQPEAIDGHVTRKGGILDRASQLQVRISYSADSGRIAKSDVMAFRCQREVKLLLQRDIATQVEFAATGLGHELLHL